MVGNLEKIDITVNKYDRLLIFLIILQIFGNIGQAFQPLRIMIVLLIPLFLFPNSLDKKILVYNKASLSFWVIWFLYSIISTSWVISMTSAFKEIVYNIINFSILPIFLILCFKANNPLISIIKGWVYFFVLTIPFAIYEFVFSVHMPTAQAELGQLYIGNGVARTYAAITFGNLNGYNQMMVYCLPFVFSSLYIKNVFNSKLLPIVSVLSIVFFIVLNSSRGATLCLITTIAFFLFKKGSGISVKTKFLFLFSIGVIGVWFYDSIFVNIVSRVSKRADNGPFGDAYRQDIIFSGLKAMKESLYMGSGPGNFAQVIDNYSSFGRTQDFIASHNLFLEIGVQYGIVILIMFFGYLINLYLKCKPNPISRFIVISALLFYPVCNIISSSYFLAVSTWMFLFSIQMFTIFNFKNKNT